MVRKPTDSIFTSAHRANGNINNHTLSGGGNASTDQTLTKSLPTIVQYRGRYCQDMASSRDYWKLENHEHLSIPGAKRILSGRRFYSKTSVSKSRVFALLSRSDRGLYSYERCNSPELRQFCTNRGIDLTARQSAKKSTIVEILELADESVTFSRFMELPPELRLAIYSAHFGTFKKGMTVVSPPITAVCSQIRAEALPLFYSTYRFGLSADYDLCATEPIGLMQATSEIFEAFPQTSLHLVRRLHLEADGWPARYNATLTCDVDLGSEHCASRVESCGVGSYTHERQKESEEASTRVTGILARMAARPEGKKLQQNDIKEILWALWSEEESESESEL
ncbi:hypothetical protein LTR17_001637 [Elasticomyces elasticus]|nr:hypothetical protein LTR17_001637 [Elasticomyces elasticus]